MTAYRAAVFLACAWAYRKKGSLCLTMLLYKSRGQSEFLKIQPCASCWYAENNMLCQLKGWCKMQIPLVCQAAVWEIGLLLNFTQTDTYRHQAFQYDLDKNIDLGHWIMLLSYTVFISIYTFSNYFICLFSAIITLFCLYFINVRRMAYNIFYSIFFLFRNAIIFNVACIIFIFSLTSLYSDDLRVCFTILS